WNGGRRRTVYSFTDSGRAALSDWLAQPSSPQRYESEALLKVFFAENGARADLLRSIRALRDDALAAVEHFQQFADAYDAGNGQYPQRFALSALVARLLSEQQAATARWPSWAEEIASNWDTPTAADAEWGVRTLRGTGQPLALAEEPVRDLLSEPRPGRAVPPVEPRG
ncbi:MAG: hypothetical protein ACTHNU_14290, partial [Gaiellales bacterium]